MEIKVGYFSLSHSLELRKKCEKKILLSSKLKAGLTLTLPFFCVPSMFNSLGVKVPLTT
jgi:hypothetical protein